MSVLEGFLSTWAEARATFGQGVPQTGEPFKTDGPLSRVQAHLTAATPGSSWSGTASAAYDAANTEHRGKVAEFANLDRRMGEQIDRAARVVTVGRTDLDAVRTWVLDAAAKAPQNAAGQQMLVPIVRRGLSDVADIVKRSNGELNSIATTIRGIGSEYSALGDQKRGKGDQPQNFGPDGNGPEPDKPPENKYEKALRDAGLLNGPADGYYKKWLENAERRGVPPQVIVEIARRHHITPDSFKVLDGMEEVKDPDGKSYFLMPKGTTGAEARKAVLMTYILNCGTDYAAAPGKKDFAETPYSADEVQRIVDRQNANSFTYRDDVDFILNADGALMTTPNGMLMGMGGNWVQDQFSWMGGSTWGDIYMSNIDHSHGPADQLRQMVESGVSRGVGPDGVPRPGTLDLDKLLHHEERHSQQWAQKGHLGMLWALTSDWMGLERDAGLNDGGYEK
jgi:hypothetical protein